MARPALAQRSGTPARELLRRMQVLLAKMRLRMMMHRLNLEAGFERPLTCAIYLHSRAV